MFSIRHRCYDNDAVVVGMSCEERSSDFGEAKSYLAGADRVFQLLHDSKVPEEWYSLPRQLVLRNQVLNEVRRQIRLLDEALQTRHSPADAFAEFRTTIDFVVFHSMNHLSDDLHELFATVEKSLRKQNRKQKSLTRVST